MSTTTEILFNSPALHSLKRDQLVKLCKIHSLKANGKNTDLVQRLKSHALTLPNDNPLSVALRSEQDEANAGDGNAQMDEDDADRRPRPSSQWEMVMDSIIEEDEGSSQGTLSSLKNSNNTTLTGEFGADSTSSKATTVSSSIRALASSLGLKRHATTSTASSKTKIISSFPMPPQNDELTRNAVPYESLPLSSVDDLQTDHFTFDTNDPAAVQAHLNPMLGTAPLPGHSLRPGMPAPINARLSLGLAPRTPSKKGPTTTLRLVSNPTVPLPPAVGGTPVLKPFHTTFDLEMGSPPHFPESIYPALPMSPPDDVLSRRISLEADHRINKSLADGDAEDVVMPGAFDASTPPRNNAPFVFGSPSPQPAMFSFKMASPAREPQDQDKITADLIAEMNRRAFAETGGQPPVVNSREIRPLPGSAKKSTASKPAGRFDKIHERMESKMESIVDTAARRENLKRKASAASVRPKDNNNNNNNKAEEVEEGPAKRVRVDAEAQDDEAKMEKRRVAEQEAMRRKVELSRARRRSSAAAGGAARRKSGRVSGAVKPKPAPAPQRGRFGFLSGAAKFVTGVWGGGAKKAPTSSTTVSTKPAAPTTIPKPVAGPSKIPMAPPPIPVTADNKSLRAPSVRSMGTTASSRSTAASRARSPLPPAFVGTTKSTGTTASSRAGGSSVGTRSSTSTRLSSQVGSMGTRGSVAGSDSVRKTASRPPSMSTSSSSRLLAPTASSLAKRASASPSMSPAPASVPEEESRALDPITNTGGPVASKASGSSKPSAKPGLAARKPRISRSRVIAKLASQRVASGSSIASASSVASSSSGRKSLGPIAPRMRSSLGAKVQRGSLGGMKNSSSRASGVGPMDAKRRARQSEYYARRRSGKVSAAAAVSEESEQGPAPMVSTATKNGKRHMNNAAAVIPSATLAAAGQTYLAQIETRLATLVSQGRYKHAEALVASLATLRSSIHTLPPELLSEIFFWTCEPRNADLSWPELDPAHNRDDDDEVYQTGALQAAVRLSHVCASWRKVVLETPRLWATIMPIRVPRGMQERAFALLVKQFLARSRSLSFPLCYGPPLGQSLRRRLVANMSRVDAMRILNAEILADMTGAKCPCLEHLEYLLLDFSKQTDWPGGVELQRRTPETPAFLTARKLVRLRLRETRLASLFLPWAQLTDLDIYPTDTSASECFEALRQCTSAVRISLSTASWSANASISSAPYLLPRLEHLHLTFIDDVGQPDDANNYNTTPMFRGLALPALKVLHLDTICYGWPADTHSAFIDFLRRAPHIDTLKLSSEFDATALRDILAVTPSLRELSLDDCSEALRDPVIEYLTYDPDSIHGQAPIDQTKLQTMIESRWSGYLQGLTEDKDKRAQVSSWEKIIFKIWQHGTENVWTMPFSARVAELKHAGLNIIMN
ncbi:SAP domain-containing protein [Mycena chlorophos]|uniref:SAP domain-containing protein n=1 Tax=Mycena chlorophos TaxID=658473 RepID=A0A8H6WHZ3_MYCCL|nr:SAP domain-containing protein [Mycena chlorophos]